MTAFTPVASLLGGILIGCSAVLLMWSTGRIAGISGLFVGAITAVRDGALATRAAFICGLLAAPILAVMVTGNAPPMQLTDDLATLAVAGLLVGFGAIWGSGCTSGHGVCGLARLSPRSLVATALFMAVAFAVVFVRRHLIGGA